MLFSWPTLVPLSVKQDSVDNDVRNVPGNDVSKHALQVVDSPNFLTVPLANASKPREAAEAATPTRGARPHFDGLTQFSGCDSLKHSMLGKLVLKLVLWNLYAQITAALSADQGAPPMPTARDLQLELAALLSSYFNGDVSMSEYLTWEVEFTTSEDASVDAGLAGAAGRLALLGHEHLMDLRTLDEFEQAARRLLAELQPTSSTSEAAGS